MGGRKDRDYTRLKTEFVTGEMSMREMAASHQIAPASLARKFRERDPATNLTTYEMRDQYRATLTGKAFDLLADQDAVQLAQRSIKMLGIADKYFTMVEQKLSDGEVAVNMRDFVLIANLVRTIIGEPTSRKEERHFGLSFSGTLTNEQAAELERGIRLRLVDGGAGSGTPQPESAISSAE